MTHVTTLVVCAVVLLAPGCSLLSFFDDEPAVESGVNGLCYSELKRLPCRAGVEQGIPYRFTLLTHCGVEYAYFDGRYWVVDPPNEDPANPPAGWGNPVDQGTMVLLSDDEAVYRNAAGGEARFRPASSEFRPPGCK